jgi:hypothetical protein
VRLPALTLAGVLLAAGCGARLEAKPAVAIPLAAVEAPVRAMGVEVDATVTATVTEPPPSREPAPTWSTLYDRYFSQTSEASCGRSRKCHASEMADAASAYTWLSQRGYISGQASAIASTRNSCLHWFGGNMPPGGKPNPRAVEDLSAWVAAGAPNN